MTGAFLTRERANENKKKNTKKEKKVKKKSKKESGRRRAAVSSQKVRSGFGEDGWEWASRTLTASPGARQRSFSR